MKITFISNYLHKNNKGQTLIEVVITLGIALIIITSIMVLVNASNRRATIARQATQASKLAQEGMEVVRNIRDEGTDAVGVGSGCSVASLCSWNVLYSIDLPSPTVEACIFFDTSTSLWNLYPLSHTNCDDEKVGGSLGGTPGNGIFERKIMISDADIGSAPNDRICTSADLDFSAVKRVTVEVNWTSPQGPEKRTAVGCLTNWR